tara:strand:+ start:304 stop:636 length:333 start_codon:yes stop_codon:yes gene_type:complete
MARTKGALGKRTTDIKEVLHVAFNKAGGCDYLVRQAAENPKAFLALLARCIPAQVALDVSVRLDLGQALIDAEANRQRISEQIIDMRPVTVEDDTVERSEIAKPLISKDK